MTSRDTKLGSITAQGPTLPFLDSIRQQIAKIPQFSHGEDGAVFNRPDLDYFSAARIYITFKVKLAEHFPERIPSETFDFLVDLMVHEWLSRRVGAERPAEFGVPRSAVLTPRIQHAIALGFIHLEADLHDEDMRLITLTRSARARLNVFFDYMASYISVL
ncbi:hypothetical protein [Sphingobium nicotianae]|uniref:Uncharacterized protein n=1 Tax=Sphingobium nicotianae TaxID=2782607 RepID=A0A9X1DCV0_9SPHN|nr:hypothetical protein [Sphingobium nicotianae]MBT2187564.1 hypothetical protein [Sphingobium nicotianae]